MTKSGKHMGPGSQGKSAGTGGMTNLDPDAINRNAALSNRDKSQHTKTRGQDGKWVQTEQLQDHEANHYDRD